MQDIDVGEKALAGYVALRVDDWSHDQGCAAWVESRDSTCRKPPLDAALLCKRHRNVALKKLDAARAKQKQQAEDRAQHRAKMLPEWRAKREQVEALMDRYGGSPTNDRAAYGGASHPSIRRKQLQQLSDTNVRRMAELSKQWQRLTELIGDHT